MTTALGIAIALGAVGCAVGVAAGQSVLSNEARAWLPHLARWLVRQAAQRLQDEERDRYEEEWLAELAAWSDRPLSALVKAAHIRWRTREMRVSLGSGELFEHSSSDEDAPVEQLIEGLPRDGNPRDRIWAVDVPNYLQELTLHVDRAVGELAEKLRRRPSVAEIVVAVGADEEAVLEALQAGSLYRVRFFDGPSNSGGEDTVTLGESIGVAEHGFARVEARETFAALLSVLTSREREVLLKRFEEDMTQAEIAAAIGTSEMQVSRIIRGALARIRRAMLR
jgi:RNA polymerase sigma factor (sigma-70 family)